MFISMLCLGLSSHFLDAGVAKKNAKKKPQQQVEQATLPPLVELKMLSELPLEVLKLPENQKLLSQTAKRSIVRFSRDNSRKTMHANSAIGTEYVKELDVITDTFREKL